MRRLASFLPNNRFRRLEKSNYCDSIVRELNNQFKVQYSSHDLRESVSAAPVRATGRSDPPITGHPLSPEGRNADGKGPHLRSVNNEDKELEILQNIYSAPSSIRQRDLAKIVGLSLGMTNAVVKRLVGKGWLKIRKVNNRNIRYVVSPAGVEAISKRSYRYFKRTIKNVVFYKESIDDLVRFAEHKGYDGVFLKGRSDLDFIVEHSCRQHGVDYVVSPEKYSGRAYTLYAETYIPDRASRTEGVSFLQELFVVS